MMRQFRWIGVLAIGGCVVLLSTGCASNSACVKQSPGMECSAGVFIHIKSGIDDPHSVLMGLRMANLMAEDRDVLVYFDVRAIGVVTKDAPDLETQPFGGSHEQIALLRDRGVPMYACPGCLKTAGKTAADLMPGLAVAEKEKFFSFTPGRILTLDY